MATTRVVGCCGLIAVLALCSCFPFVARQPRPPPFFFSGDGTLTLTNAHFEETIDVRYRTPQGRYDSVALEQIAHVFRSTDNQKHAVSLRLVELLAYIQQEFKPNQMLIVSGYRSPDYNATLAGAAQTSLHTQGLAADVMFKRIDLIDLWNALREREVGGVGSYEDDGYLHIDVGPPRFWEKQTSRVGENLSAGNARVFARTPIDRYASLEISRVEIHSVTLFPLRIERTAALAGYPDAMVHLERFYSDGECIEIAKQRPQHFVYIKYIENMPQTRGKRTRLLLSTCEPRLGQTPEVIESNEIEIGTW